MATKRPASLRMLSCGIATVLACASAQAVASGFALMEQSVSSMGTAHAGAGSNGEDASTVFFNPALMSRLDGNQLSVGVHYVMPDAKFSGSAAYNPSHPAFNAPSPAAGLNGVPITPGADNDSNGGENGVVPHFTYVHSLNDRLKVGLTVNTPFGLNTKYGSQWVGRYSAIDSQITAVNINPVLSFKVDDHTSIGFGISAVYGSLKLTNAVDLGLNAALQSGQTQDNCQVNTPNWCPGTSTYDAIVKNDVTDWAYGWNFGVLLEPSAHTRLGLAYRSGIDLQLDGNLSSNVPSAIPSTSSKVKASLPDSILLSAYHDLNSQWAVMADVMWTRWSTIDALVARLGNGTTNTIPLKWEDTTRVALGASYRQSDRLVLRGGIAYDQTPVPDAQYRPAALPDEDRKWLSLGAGYQATKQLSFDVAYAHLFVKNTSINSTDAYSSLAAPVTEGFHRLTGSYDASVDILSAQANWKF
jgi:long-chain fatty acid transport protein